MSWCGRWIAPLALAGAAWAATAVDGPVAPDGAPTVAAQIRQLGDESYKVREKATRELWSQGESVLPALREAMNDKNPEIAYRARELVRKVELFLTPDTDETVVSLVERYVASPPDGRFQLMGHLKVKRAWRQMLKLYASETDAAQRVKLLRMVDGVAVQAARERLAADDVAGAREFLEMGPADAAGLLALAEFHRTQGTWDQEWERSGKLAGGRRHEWQLALLRAKGDLIAAREAAGNAGDDEIAAYFAALDGDPLPWLAARSGRISRDTDLGKLYTQFVIKRWKGGEVRENELAPFLKALASRGRSTRFAAMGTLAALGEGSRAAKTFASIDPVEAAGYFETQEQDDEALRALGIDPAAPDYGSWISKRLRDLTEADVEDQREPRDPAGELIALAGFLERKGLHDQVWEMFAAPMENLAEDDTASFEELVSSMFKPGSSLGAPVLGARLGGRWAADDETRWESLAISTVGEEEVALRWWDWLAEMKPDESAPERFRGLQALFRLGPDPDNLQKVWLDRAWRAVDDAQEEKRPRLLQWLAEYGTYNDDALTFLRAYDRMEESAQKQLTWDARVQFLTAAGRWAEAADLLQENIGNFEEMKLPVPAEVQAFTAASLRLAGRENDAARHDRLAEQTALGDAETAYGVATRYSYCFDSARAAEWFRKAALWSDPDSPSLFAVLRLHADDLLTDGDWLRAAAVGELVTVLIRVNDEYGMPFSELIRARLQADTARALARLESDREASLLLLGKCHQQFRSDGSLADFFFPSLRKAGLRETHDRLFEETWKTMAEAIAKYPDSDNTRNTAAWFASRSLLRLKEARSLLEKALALRPRQPAYLDTMAEIHFALKQRDEAIRWSSLGLLHAPGDPLLRRQHERFLKAPFPD